MLNVHMAYEAFGIKRQEDYVKEDYVKTHFSYVHTSLTRERKKVQVGNDQEKAQSEKDSHSKNRGGKKLN